MTTEKLVLDANNAIAGRLAAYTAKRLVEGYEVIIVNSENAVFSGNLKKIVEKYTAKRNIQQKSDPDKSQKLPRRPDLFLRKVIYGMTPKNRVSTRKACMHNLRCYMGVPKDVKAKPIKAVKTGDKLRLKPVTIKQICLKLGWEEK